MANLLDIVGLLGGQQDERRQATQIPQPMPLQPAAQPQADAAPGLMSQLQGGQQGLLGVLSLISNLNKIGGGDFSSLIPSREEQARKQKAKTEQNIAQLTGSALGTSKQDLGSPEQLFNAFSQAGASPEDARATLNFIQGQQKKADPSENESAALAAHLPGLAKQNIKGPEQKLIIDAINEGNPKLGLAIYNSVLGRDIAAGNKEFTRTKQAITNAEEVAKKQQSPVVQKQLDRFQALQEAGLQPSDIHRSDEDFVKHFGGTLKEAKDAKAQLQAVQKQAGGAPNMLGDAINFISKGVGLGPQVGGTLPSDFAQKAAEQKVGAEKVRKHQEGIAASEIATEASQKLYSKNQELLQKTAAAKVSKMPAAVKKTRLQELEAIEKTGKR